MAYDGVTNGNKEHASIVQAFSGIYSGSTGISAILKTITDTVPLGFYVVDARSEKIVYFNDRFCDIWGLGHLKGQMREGQLDNRDIAPEIIRRTASISTSPARTVPEKGSEGAAIDELRLCDGRIIRRFSASISYENGSRVGSLYAFEDITEQARAQEKISKSNERYMALANELPQIVIEMDLQGKVTFSNRSAFTLMGYTEEDFSGGLNAIAIVAPEDRARALDNLAKVLQGGQSGNEYVLMRKDGSRMPAIVNTRPVYRDGIATGFLGIIVDITERRKAEEQIKVSLREKEALLMEIHHRVRNNLQVISSLLSLQMAYVDDFVAVGLLKESQSRIRTIALVHEKLYGSTDFARIEFKDYLEKLGLHLALANEIAPGNVKVIIEGDDIAMEPDVVVPCGLIVSELFTDSMKRAAMGGLPDLIRITVHDGERITIAYADNCPVEPSRATGGETERFSQQLVNMLVEQLDGTFGYDVSRNAVIIEFPARNKQGLPQDRLRQV
jgi:PAS domain S-box-containing protein